MEEKNLICINCPLGCPLTVTLEGGEVKTVSGNTCPRGEAYARKELTMTLFPGWKESRQRKPPCGWQRIFPFPMRTGSWQRGIEPHVPGVVGTHFKALALASHVHANCLKFDRPLVGGGKID